MKYHSVCLALKDMAFSWFKWVFSSEDNGNRHLICSCEVLISLTNPRIGFGTIYQRERLALVIGT